MISYIKLENSETKLINDLILSDQKLFSELSDFADNVRGLPDCHALILKEVKERYYSKFESMDDFETKSIGLALLSKIHWDTIAKMVKTTRSTHNAVEASDIIFLSFDRESNDYYNRVYCNLDKTIEVSTDRILEFVDNNKDKTVQIFEQRGVNINCPNGMKYDISLDYSGKLYSFNSYYTVKKEMQGRTIDQKIDHSMVGPSSFRILHTKYEFDFKINGRYLDRNDSKKCAKLFFAANHKDLAEFMNIIQFKYALDNDPSRRFSSNHSFRCCGHKINCNV
jgi:hypothetical protein